MKKRVLSILLALVLLVGCLPLSVSAAGTYQVLTGKRGKDFATGALADRLDKIITSGISDCVTPSLPAVGGKMSGDSYKITYRNESGSSTDWTCLAYQRAAFSYLFGYNVGSATERVNFTDAKAKNKLTYEQFKNWGVRCGATMRTTCNSDGSWHASKGHSLIILGYDKNGITTLEGNYSSLKIGILYYTWNNFNAYTFTDKGRYVCGFGQPNDTVYSSLGYSASSAPASPVSITPGVYTIHSARNDDMVLDIQGGSKQVRANIQLYKTSGGTTQKFRVAKSGDAYTIQSVYSNLWLDTASPYGFKANVQLWNTNTSKEQKWSFEDAGDGYVYIKNGYDGHYLDIQGDAAVNNANVQLYTKESDSQRWRLVLDPNPITVTPGVYTIHSARNNNMVLDIEGDSKANRANIQMYEALGNTIQQFRIAKSGNYYTIQSVFSNLWLDIAKPIVTARANVQLYDTNSNNEEKWFFEDAGNGYVYIRNYYGNYLDIKGDAAVNKANVQMWWRAESASQKWKLTPVTTGSETTPPPETNTATITFNGNGGSGIPAPIKVTRGKQATLPMETPTLENRTFMGWSTLATATTPSYLPGNTITVNENITLYAVWQQVGDVNIYVFNFYDVSANAYYADAVAWAVENSITNGTSATTFSPSNSCTRAQAVTFLWRAAGEPEPTITENPFTDVTPDDYYYKAVLWAVENGITGGTSATTFSPKDTCSRSQIVTFMYREAGSPSVAGSTFDDVSNNAYYADAVQWAVAQEITGGTGNGKFSPNSSCTRAQIVTFLYRNAQ